MAKDGWSRGRNPTLENGISRRGALLRGTAIAVGSVALAIGATMPAEAKMAPKAAGYQDTPKDGQTCATCSFFKGPSACTLVDGAISPNGWCRFYSKKS